MERFIKLTRNLPIARIRHFMCSNSQACAGDRSFSTRHISTFACSPQRQRALAARTGSRPSPSVCLCQLRSSSETSHVGLCCRTLDGRHTFSTLSVNPQRLADPTTYVVTGVVHNERTLLNLNMDGTSATITNTNLAMAVRKKSTNSKGKSKTKAVRDEEDDDDEVSVISGFNVLLNYIYIVQQFDLIVKV